MKLTCIFFQGVKWCYMTCFTIVEFIWVSVIGPLAIVNSYLFLYVGGLFNNMHFIDESCICFIIPVLYFFVAHTVCLVHKQPLNIFHGADWNWVNNLFIQGFNHLSVVLCSHYICTVIHFVFSIHQIILSNNLNDWIKLYFKSTVKWYSYFVT